MGMEVLEEARAGATAKQAGGAAILVWKRSLLLGKRAKTS